MVDLFDEVYYTLVEVTPKLELKRYDLVKKATEAMEKHFYPALDAKLDCDSKLGYRVHGREIDVAFFSNTRPTLAVEHENISDGFVAQEVYKLLTLEDSFRYNVGITYQTNPILRRLLLIGTSFLYRELGSDLKMMIILGSAPYAPKDPWIQWRRCELDIEGNFVEKQCTDPLPLM